MSKVIEICLILYIFSGLENKPGCNSFPSQQNTKYIPSKFWTDLAKRNDIPKPDKETVKMTTPLPAVTFVVPIFIAPDVINKDDAPVVANAESAVAASVVESVPITGDAPVPVDVPSGAIATAPKYPCKCKDLKCSCCTVFLEGWNQKGCANVRFLPEEFAMEMKLTMNGDPLFTRKVTEANRVVILKHAGQPVGIATSHSARTHAKKGKILVGLARDPPPICFNPRRFPLVDVCARLSNIRIKDRSAQVCVDIDANIGSFSVYERSFDCLKFGPQGILTGQKPFKVKPSNIPAVNLFGNNDDDEDSEEYFDDDADLDIFDY